MDDSKFNLWRACFSFCFIDGFLSAQEQSWIDEKLKTLKFSLDQRGQLMQDLKGPPRIDELLPLITKPADRGFLVNTMRVLANLDSDVTSQEQLKIKEVSQAVLAKIDLAKVASDLQKAQDPQVPATKREFMLNLFDRLGDD